MPSAFVARFQRRSLLCTLLLCAAGCAQTGSSTPRTAASGPSAASSRQSRTAYELACDEFDLAIRARDESDFTASERHVNQAMRILRKDGIEAHLESDPLGLLDSLASFAYFKIHMGSRATLFWTDVVGARVAAGISTRDLASQELPVVSDVELDALALLLRERDSSLANAGPAESTLERGVQDDGDEVPAAVSAATVPEAIFSTNHADSGGSEKHAAVAATPVTPGASPADRGIRDSSLLAAQLDLARVQIAQGKLDEARRILEEVLAEIERRGLKGGRDELAALALLSASFKVENAFERAREFDQRRVQFASANLPAGDPQRDEAEQDLLAMDLATDTPDSGSSGGPAAPRVSTGTSGRNGRSRDPRYRRDGDENAVGSGRPTTLDGVQLTGGGPDARPSGPPTPQDLESEGRFKEAADGYRSLLADIQLTTPSDVDALTDAREGEARCHDELGQTDAAAELRERNLEDARKSFGDSDPRVQRARRALAQSKRTQGDLPAARTHQEDACAALAATHPPDHPDLVAARLWLSDLLRELGETEAALLLLEQTLSAEVANAVDRARLAALVREALDLQARCRFEEAIAVRRELVEAGRRALPAGSPAHAESVRELAALLRTAGERDEARSLELQLCQEGRPQAWPGELHARAAEASKRSDDAQRYPPSVDLTLTADEPSGQLVVFAVVRDATGIATLSLGVDGILYELALRPPQWMLDADGMGGRLELRFPDPGGLVSVVTLIAENAIAGRETQSRAVVTDR